MVMVKNDDFAAHLARQHGQAHEVGRNAKGTQHQTQQVPQTFTKAQDVDDFNHHLGWRCCGCLFSCWKLEGVPRKKDLHWDEVKKRLVIGSLPPDGWDMYIYIYTYRDMKCSKALWSLNLSKLHARP